MTTFLHKADKPQLAEAIETFVTSTSDTAIPQTIKETDNYVLDGGSLLHRMKWIEGCTYSSIADEYASFTKRHYGKTAVVISGYEGPRIKDNTHQRRERMSSYL